ncbi:MAG: glycosyltransferase family 1 protein [Patescibacteria group bacterium]
MLTLAIDASRANREKRTGVENYAWEIIEELKKQLPNNIQVILYSQEKLKGQLAILPENWSSKVLSWPPKKFWTQIRLSLEMILHRPDILFIPAHVFPLIHPKKTVMTVHDVAALNFPETYNRFERWYTIWSVKKALKKMWKIITPSIFTKKEILRLTKKKEKVEKKIFVIPHGYRKKENLILDLDIKNEIGLKGDYLLSIGRLEEKKNSKRIIEAFDLLKQTGLFPDLFLVLIGKKGFGFEKVFLAIQKSNFKNQIILTDWLCDEKAFALLETAKIFVFPSLYEGFGLPVLEAFEYEVPVLTSVNGGSLSEIGGTACLYVDGLNSEDISKKLKEILDSESLREEMKKQGKEELKKYSWEKAGQETIKILLS